MKKTSKRTGGSRRRSPARPPRPARARPAKAPALEGALVAFADLAERLGLRWYVFGAQAVNLHGFPRTTADLDLTIDLGALTPRVLVSQLGKAGFSPRFDDDEFIALTRVIPVVHRGTKLPIDLVIAGPGLEQQFLDEVQLQWVGARRVPVLSPENLIVTKLLAARPKDLEDIRELIARRDSSLDHRRIEELLALLEQAPTRATWFRSTGACATRLGIDGSRICPSHRSKRSSDFDQGVRRSTASRPHGVPAINRVAGVAGVAFVLGREGFELYGRLREADLVVGDLVRDHRRERAAEVAPAPAVNPRRPLL